MTTLPHVPNDPVEPQWQWSVRNGALVLRTKEGQHWQEWLDYCHMVAPLPERVALWAELLLAL